MAFVLLVLSLNDNLQLYLNWRKQIEWFDFSLHLHSILLCVYAIFSISTHAVGHQGRPHILAISLSNTINGGMHKLLWLDDFCALGIETKKLVMYHYTVNIFMRNYHTIFYRSWTKQYSNQQWMAVPFLLHCHEHRLFPLVFFMWVILTDVR